METQLSRSHYQCVCSILTIGCSMKLISETSSMLTFSFLEIRVFPSYSLSAPLSKRLSRPLWLLQPHHAKQAAHMSPAQVFSSPECPYNSATSLYLCQDDACCLDHTQLYRLKQTAANKSS